MDREAIQKLQAQLRCFAADRDWEQFHSPKNLVMALSVEVSEIVEHFQWLTQKESVELPKDKLEEIELELADVFIYLLRLADKLNVDLMSAASRKTVINEQKYPAEKVRGSAKKSGDYEQ